MTTRRKPAGRLRAFPPPRPHLGLEGAALPGGDGLWVVLPEGESELRVTSGPGVLCARWKSLGHNEIELPMFPCGQGFGTAPTAVTAQGDDLARVRVVTLDALDGPPASMGVDAGEGGRLTVSPSRRGAERSGVLCAYRACAADPLAFASACARRIDDALALLRDLGARRAVLSLSLRDAPPVTARLSLARGLPETLGCTLLRALSRGAACAVSIDAGWASVALAPSERGAAAANETVVSVDRAAVPERVEAALRCALEDAVAGEHPGALQAWCAALPEALHPRCVGRWERARGVRALPLTAGWLGTTLRAGVPRAWIDGAWREGEALQVYQPRSEGFRDAVAPRGAGAGSPRVRALWRRTGGAPMQGGIA